MSECIKISRRFFVGCCNSLKNCILQTDIANLIKDRVKKNKRLDTCFFKPSHGFSASSGESFVSAHMAVMLVFVLCICTKAGAVVHKNNKTEPHAPTSIYLSPTWANTSFFASQMIPIGLAMTLYPSIPEAMKNPLKKYRQCKMQECISHEIAVGYSLLNENKAARKGGAVHGGLWKIGIW